MYGSPSASKRAIASPREIFSARPVAAFLQLTLNLGFDRSEIGLGDRLREVEVVVEAVLDRGPDRHLDAGIEPPHGFGKQVGCRVPQHVEGVGICGVARGQKVDVLPVGERQAHVLRRPVRADEHGLLSELRPDRARGIEPRRAGGKFELRIVG